MIGVVFILYWISWVLLAGYLIVLLYRHDKEREECDRLLKELFECYYSSSGSNTKEEGKK